MRGRTAVLAALATAGLALTVGGCSDGGNPFDVASTSTGPTVAPPTTVPPSTPLSLPSAIASARNYVNAPPDVRLSEPGSALAVKDHAIVGWAPRNGYVGVVKLKVAKLQTSTIAKAFADYQLDDDTKTSTPYFVTLVVTNKGATDLAGLTPPVYVQDDRDDLIEPTGFGDTFTPCADAVLPTPFGPGEKTTLCLVYLTPKGTTLTAVLFQPPVGVEPITWTGEPTQLHLGTGTKTGNGGTGR